MTDLQLLVISDMAKKAPAAPPSDREPPSETVRVAGDVIEMMREICFHTRTGSSNRRLKLAELADQILRPAVGARLKEVRRRVAHGPDGAG